MEYLNFNEAEKETIDYISKNKIMVLATSSKDRVTARMMSIINDGMTIYFQTDTDFLKYRQIKENPNVALCIGNIQIEGVAKITCHSLENPFFVEVYKKNHEGSFAKYSHLKDATIIEVQPKRVTYWKYDEVTDMPFRDFLDLEQREAYREYYQMKSSVSFERDAPKFPCEE